MWLSPLLRNDYFGHNFETFHITEELAEALKNLVVLVGLNGYKIISKGLERYRKKVWGVKNLRFVLSTLNKNSSLRN